MTTLFGTAVVFLNGPPRAGKDTAVNALHRKVRGMVKMKLSEPLKRTTHEMYGLDGYPHDAFEAGKDQPNPLFFGKSPRDAYIEVKDRMVSPAKGEDFYGRVLVTRARRMVREMPTRRAALIGISDLNSPEEADPIILEVGADNCLVLRVHASKRGCSFYGDGRNYLTASQLPGVYFMDVSNDVDGDPHSFGIEVVRTVQRWLDNLEQARLRGAIVRPSPDAALAKVIDPDPDVEMRNGGPARGRAGANTTEGRALNEKYAEREEIEA